MADLTLLWCKPSAAADVQGQFFVPVYKMSFLLSRLSRDCVSIQTGSKKSRMPFGKKKLRKCPSNYARADALSMGWQDVLKQRKRPLLGRPPLWYLLPLSRLNSING